MKKLLLASALFTLPIAGCATADATYNDYAHVTAFGPIYETRRVKEVTKVCHEEEFPVYGTKEIKRSANGGDVLAGMIIGGLLGKGVTGKDKGAAAGAVIGGVVAADKGHREFERVIVGYETKTICNNHVEYVNKSELAYYLVSYSINGHYGEFKTKKKYNIGDRIKVRVEVDPIREYPVY